MHLTRSAQPKLPIAYCTNSLFSTLTSPIYLYHLQISRTLYRRTATFTLTSILSIPHGNSGKNTIITSPPHPHSLSSPQATHTQTQAPFPQHPPNMTHHLPKTNKTQKQNKKRGPKNQIPKSPRAKATEAAAAEEEEEEETLISPSSGPFQPGRV